MDFLAILCALAVLCVGLCFAASIRHERAFRARTCPGKSPHCSPFGPKCGFAICPRIERGTKGGAS